MTRHTTLTPTVPVEERTAKWDGGGDLTEESLDMSRRQGIEHPMSTKSVQSTVMSVVVAMSLAPKSVH